MSTKTEALRVAKIIHSYLSREDSEPGTIARALFDTLRAGGQLRLLDLIIAWLTMHRDQYRITGEATHVSAWAEQLLKNIENPLDK